MQKNNSIKLRAAFTHLFSKNIEFPKLAKIEIIFNKYCRQWPILINSQVLRKIKLRFGDGCKAIANLEYYISIDVIKRVKSIKIIIESPWTESIIKHHSNMWLKNLSKEICSKIKICYCSVQYKYIEDLLDENKIAMKKEKVLFFYPSESLINCDYSNVVDFCLAHHYTKIVNIKNQMRKLWIDANPNLSLKKLRMFLKNQSKSLKKLTIINKERFNDEELKDIDNIIDDMRLYKKFKRFNGFYIKNDKKNREKTDIVISKIFFTTNDTLITHILKTLIKKYNRKFDLIYYKHDKGLIKENIKDYIDNQNIITLVTKPKLINKLIAFILEDNGSLESYKSSILSKFSYIKHNKIYFTEDVFDDDYYGKICEEYLIRILAYKFSLIAIRNAIIQNFSFIEFNPELRIIDISNITFLGNSFDSFIIWISKMKQLSELIIANCGIISYAQFYNLLLNIVNLSNIKILLLDIPIEPNDNLSSELIELIKKILQNNSLCLKSIYV